MKFYNIANNPQYLKDVINLVHNELHEFTVSKQEKQNQFEDELKNNLTQIYALKQDKEIIGCYKITKDLKDDTIWLSLVLIKQDKRGLGYGGELLRHIKHTLNASKYNKVFVRTTLTGFYEKIGFTYLKDDGQEKLQTVKIYVWQY